MAGERLWSGSKARKPAASPQTSGIWELLFLPHANVCASERGSMHSCCGGGERFVTSFVEREFWCRVLQKQSQAKGPVPGMSEAGSGSQM